MTKDSIVGAMIVVIGFQVYNNLSIFDFIYVANWIMPSKLAKINVYYISEMRLLSRSGFLTWSRKTNNFSKYDCSV